MIIAVLFLVFLAVFFAGVYAGDGEFRGWPAVISFFGVCSTGLALAVHAL